MVVGLALEFDVGVNVGVDVGVAESFAVGFNVGFMVGLEQGNNYGLLLINFPGLSLKKKRKKASFSQINVIPL